MKNTHIVLGESAGGVLRIALGCGPKSILVQHDPLTVGPLPRVKSLDEWRAIREAFWDGVYPDWRRYDARRDLLVNVRELRSRDAITVWVGGGASDQLFLPWIVHLFALLDAPIRGMSVVQIDRLPSRNLEVIGIGELSPEKLRTLAHPVLVTPEGVAELKAFWSALTASRPDELLRSIRNEAAAFPLVRRALRTTLDRFPDVRTGLSHWDLELLSQVRGHGPKAASVIGQTMGDSSRANYPDAPGDLYLFSRMRQMADRQLVEPALVMEGNMSSYSGCEVRITAAGEAFLEGRKNFVEVNGIDEWVAGVHLDSRKREVWFRDGEGLIEANAV